MAERSTQLHYRHHRKDFRFLRTINPEGQLRHWLRPHIEMGLEETNDAKTRSVEYRVNPKLLRDSDYKGKTTLKRIEPHRLRELILEDLKIYGPTSIKDINARIGEEINVRSIQRHLKVLTEEGIVIQTGATNNVRYKLATNPV